MESDIALFSTDGAVVREMLLAEEESPEENTEDTEVAVEDVFEELPDEAEAVFEEAAPVEESSTEE